MRPPVPDDAVVLRGGTLRDRELTAQSAETAELRIRIYGLSVECFSVERIEDALRATRLPHRDVRITTARRLRAAGMEVLATGEAPHATLRLSKPLNQANWKALQGAFDEPMRNRYARQRVG